MQGKFRLRQSVDTLIKQLHMNQHQQAAIIRGPSGSGKSTIASLLVKEFNFRAVEADDYFVVDGAYRYDPAKLTEAHALCLQAFKDSRTFTAFRPRRSTP